MLQLLYKERSKLTLFCYMEGFFAGTFAVAAPIFTGEVTDAAIRGAVGSTFDMMISLGILFM